MKKGDEPIAQTQAASKPGEPKVVGQFAGSQMSDRILIAEQPFAPIGVGCR
jgi:hypothetical protein